MRFSKQRASMGGAAKAEAGLAQARVQPPAQKLFITPRREVNALCRLALLRYLDGCGADLAAAATAYLDARAGELQAGRRPRREVWVRLKALLHSIKVVDPACGEAHLLIGMFELLDGLIQHADEVLGLDTKPEARRVGIIQNNLFGVEAQQGTLLRAQQRLQKAVWGADTVGRPAVPSNLVHGDSLLERDEFHWADQFHRVMASGGFHLVVGNPPYVRHEQIADPLGRLPTKQYKQQVFAVVQARLDAYLDSGTEGGVPASLSRRSDLSLLFTVFGLSLLDPGGVLGFVMPNAISSARYGEPLWRLLSRGEFGSYMVENLARRSFADAAVNTALLLVWRRTEAATKSTARSAGAHRAPSAGSNSTPVSPDGNMSGLNRLQSQIGHRCIPLGSIGRLRYPIKTGLNRFFYPGTETCTRFHIEPEFLVPVVKSPREVQTLAPVRGDLSSVLFHCPHAPAMLRQRGAFGALSYISWGAEQTRQGGRGSARALVPWPLLPSLQGRDLWYAVPLPDTAQVLCPRFLHRRFFFVLPGPGILEDQTFYGLMLAPCTQQHRLLLGALLNSSLAYLVMETHGRTGLGDGVRQYALRDMAELPVPDAGRVEASTIPLLIDAFQRLAARPLMSIEDEVQQADREELDTLVCRSIGLSAADGAEARHYLTALVSRRLERARCL